MSLPYARTDDEAHLYMSLRPCMCGEPDLAGLTVTSDDAADQIVVKQFSGHCSGCGRLRRFTFQVPRQAGGTLAEVRYGIGDEPSRLLDAGEWRGIAELLASGAIETLGADGPVDGKDIFPAFHGLRSAVAAMDEVLKFLPSDQESLPESAFTSRDGRLVYETAPDRLTRQQLTADRDELHQLLDDLVERYGGPDEEPDDEADDGAGGSRSDPAGPVTGRTLPVARTTDEAEIYIGMNPCGSCGEEAFDHPAWIVEVDGAPVARYAGPCPRCRTAREFTFRVLEHQPIPEPDRPRFGSERPSELLDAGQWLWVADRIANDGPAGPEPDMTAADRLHAQFRLLTAAAAVGEAMKFAPAGADGVLRESLWSDDGRTLYDRQPERFTLHRLKLRQRTYREQAERFVV